MNSVIAALLIVVFFSALPVWFAVVLRQRRRRPIPSDEPCVRALCRAEMAAKRSRAMCPDGSTIPDAGQTVAPSRMEWPEHRP